MEIDLSIVADLIKVHYNITPKQESVKPLSGYYDRNFSFTDVQDESKKYVLKIVNEKESNKDLTDVIDHILDSAHKCSIDEQKLSFYCPKLIRSSENLLSVLTTVRQKQSLSSEYEDKLCNLKLFEFYSGLTLNEFLAKHQDKYEISEIFFRLGKLSGKLSNFLMTKQHLVDSLKNSRRDDFSWQLITADKFVKEQLKSSSNLNISPEKLHLIEGVLEEFKDSQEKLVELPVSILHGDLSLMNMIINVDEPERICLVDFQDLQLGPEVVELTILIIQSIMQHDCLELEEAVRLIPVWIWNGYKSISKRIIENDLKLMPILTKLRLCQSLLNCIIAHEADPTNEYIMGRYKRVCRLLELMSSQAAVNLMP